MADLSKTVDGLLGLDKACGCGVRHRIETLAVEAGRGAIGSLPSVAEKLGLKGPVMIVSDPNTYKAAGAPAKERLSSAGLECKTVVLDKPGLKRLHADDKLVSEVEGQIPDGTGFCVAAGAGTINDLVKLASFRRGVPYIVVATAASMNGYTSAIAAVEVAGIKRTISCHQPLAVIGDLDVLMSAPPELKASGVGDLMSKPVCNADWQLSHLVRGDYYCDMPIGIAGDAAAEVASGVEGVRENRAESMSTLFHALLLSGFSMKIAGSSAPASGGEHLISHFWDMRATEKGREPGLHGAQVGVATLMTAKLYCIMRDEWRELVENAMFEVTRHGEVVRRFDSLYGTLAGEVKAEYAKKFPSGDACTADIETVKRLSAEIEGRIWPALLEPGEIRRVLSAAGAPVKVKELGLAREEAMEALLHGREIRGRYTVLDLGWEMGVLRRYKGDIVGEVNGRNDR